jgi:dipeptidyl-peptidase-4
MIKEKHMNRIFLIAAIAFSSIVLSQNKLLTIQEAVLKGRTSLAPKRLQALSFIPNHDQFSYIDNNTIFIGDKKNGKTVPLIKLDELNQKLKSFNKDTLSSLTNISWKNKSEFYFSNKKEELMYNIDKKLISETDRKAEPTNLEEYLKEPVTGAYSYCKDNNLYVVKDGKETQVTTDGSYEIVYTGKNVHQNEFGIDGKNFWSPKGNYLAFYRMDQSMVTDYPIIDWTTRPAKNINIKYPMAGNPSHHVTLGIYDVKNNKTIFVKTTGDKEQYLTNITWSADEKFIYIAVLNRGQNHMTLNEYNAINGEFVRTLFEEKDEKYVEPLHAMLFVKNNPKQFIWQSRRDGYNHFYLYDISGKLIKQLTKGTWEVKSENGFDEKGERLFFHANEQSPINQDFYSVNLKSGKITRITSGSGFHICVMDEKGNFIIDNFSAINTPREYYVINISSPKNNVIYTADNPIKDYKLGKWNVFTIKNNEGVDLYCRLVKPVDFDSTKKYPVINTKKTPDIA